ncbi:MAG TPA: hypothetical protein VF877_01650 [Gaiellaceae bacterium]
MTDLGGTWPYEPRWFKTMASLAEAKEWRREAGSKVSRGELRAPSKTTLREAGEKLIEGMRSGSVPDLC